MIGVALGSHLGLAWDCHGLVEDANAVSVFDGELNVVYIYRLEQKVLDAKAAHLAVPFPYPVEQLRVALYVADVDLGELALELSCVDAQLDEPFSGRTNKPSGCMSIRAGSRGPLSTELRVRFRPWSMIDAVSLVR
jgi:hypothetical protein